MISTVFTPMPNSLFLKDRQVKLLEWKWPSSLLQERQWFGLTVTKSIW